MEAEIKANIAGLQSDKKLVDEIPFRKAQSKYEREYGKFNDIYSSSKQAENIQPEKVLRVLDWGKLVPGADQPSEKEQQITQAMTKILTTCWECNELQQPEKDKFKELVKTVQGRRIFCECLNYYRKNAIFSMKEKAYHSVVELMHLALDIIQAENDIESALQVMILSQTFHLEQKSEGKNERVFLEEGIRKHPCWKNRILWEKAISAGADEDLKTQQTGTETKSERKARVDGTVFGKLSTFSQNMLDFGMSKAEVEQIVLTHAKSRALPQPYMDMLNVRIKREKRRRKSYWNRLRAR